MEDLGFVALSHGSTELTILQLTDLHYFHRSCHIFRAKGREINVNEGRYENARLPKTCETLIKNARPDLVVLTGDVLDGRSFVNEPRDSWKDAMMDLIRVIETEGCAWTFVPGNHDDDRSPWTREDLLGVFSLGTKCISKGATSFNHVVVVGNSKDDPTRNTRLWLFDSGGNHVQRPELRYHTFDANAVNAFRRLSASSVRVGLELAFFHIPFKECEGLSPVVGRNGLFDAALRSGKVPRPFCWMSSLVRLLGKDRIVGSSKLDSDLYDAMVEYGRISCCFFGHDHFSDAVFFRHFYMAYGRVSGRSPPIDWEGDGGTLPFAHGGRVVRWTMPGASSTSELRTWVETEHGAESDSNVRLDRPPVPRPHPTGRTTVALLSVTAAALAFYFYQGTASFST